MLVLAVLALLGLLLIVGRGVRRLVQGAPSDNWTPAPVTYDPRTLTAPPAILPTKTPGWVSGGGPTPAIPAPDTPAPAATQTVTVPAPVPTPDPGLVVITEADVVRAVASGVTAQGGLSLEGLSVQFADEKMRLAADRLRYGSIDVQSLVLVGRLTAAGGKLQLEAESIAPRGLVTALIPTFANQALAQYTAQWYIEEVRTLDGRLELRVR